MGEELDELEFSSSKFSPFVRSHKKQIRLQSAAAAAAIIDSTCWAEGKYPSEKKNRTLEDLNISETKSF